ncbi:MarR family transcriptional regulator [Dactylosporangium sp. NPDC000555]|uniref:MarR family winged helix-turn-helix transcriptional regulator n=1 Tax=Dactylosporangium sp. NPDC000555 TaxID=3154260 RepID=UPI0033300555
MRDEQHHGRTGTDRDDVVDQVIDAFPDWINTLVHLNGLIAERMGVVASDFHCLHALARGGPTTASALVERVGLTPGSVSRMIDRLEAAGCIKRVPDRADRRRTLIEPTAEGLNRVSAYYAGLTARTRDDLTVLDDGQLRALLRFIAAAGHSAAAEVDRLRSDERGRKP